MIQIQIFLLNQLPTNTVQKSQALRWEKPTILGWKKEITHVDLELYTELNPTQVNMLYMHSTKTAKQPTDLHECIETDELDRAIHNNS